MIYFDKVSKTYLDKTKALNDVSFTIEPGQFASVVGHSGSGKSTLLKMIIAEEKPSKGKVFFDSTNIHQLPGHQIADLRRRIGCVFQDFRLLPAKNIFENVAFIMETAGRSEHEIAEDVPHALDLVGLTPKIWSFPSQLSSGERQRVAIARAIVNQPDLLLADEPTANLDPTNTLEIVDILCKINDTGTTVLMTTHNKGVIDKLGRRVITLEDGQVTRDDKTGKYVL
ncbi:MAG: cell division ATP-binding protein FtsE [Patescibacteria group bacterium]|nr:cell division ATP-binding protein FtsE [Patescibacteria group bacterium]